MQKQGDGKYFFSSFHPEEGINVKDLDIPHFYDHGPGERGATCAKSRKGLLSLFSLLRDHKPHKDRKYQPEATCHECNLEGHYELSDVFTQSRIEFRSSRCIVFGPLACPS